MLAKKAATRTNGGISVAVANMNVWIVALCELEESKQVTRRLGIRETMLRHAKDGCGI
jgi:hypothetical protein